MPGPDRLLAGYVLKERIGIGGMAEIFRAVRKGPGEFAKQVAIKMVLPDLSQDPEFVSLFQQEAQLSARLASPNLVGVFDFGEQGGNYFLVMEYIDGLDLASLLSRHGPLPLGLAVFVARQLCAGLADLHAATGPDGEPLRIIHRDVNPGNVLLSCSGDVKLGDFGIAKARAHSTRTGRGTIRGKLAYLSPEQARGDELDQRADLYALGLVLFEAATGLRYLEADSEVDLLRLAASPVFRAPSRELAHLPVWLDQVLGRALAEDPARRYPTARQLDEALAANAPGDPAGQRRALGELVASIRQKTAKEQSTARRPASPLLPGAARVQAQARPQTEVLAPAQKSRPVRLWRWLGAAALAVVMAAAVLAALALRDREPKLPARPVPRPSGDRPAPLPRRDASARPRAATDGRIDSVRPDASVGRRGPAPGRIQGPAAARRPPPARSPQVSKAKDAGPAKDAPRASPGQGARLAALLGRIDRLLADKGILPDDAPDLFSKRRAMTSELARGVLREPSVQDLLSRCQALTIDRAFVEAKLRRIDRKINAARLDARLEEEVRGRARRALSYAVTGRYPEANRELNAITRVLER